MGLTHSASVSEASFLTKVERNLVQNGIMHEYHIEHVFRFKDDILLLLGGDRIKWYDFFARMRHAASPFEIECTAVSKTKIDFLELSIANENGNIVFRPRTKATKLPVPHLAMDSAHHPRVLGSWQVPYTDRRCSLCSLREDKRVEIFRAILQFREQGFPASITHKLHSLLDKHCLGIRKPVKILTNNRRCIWLVVPFMPCFEKLRLERSLRSFLDTPWVCNALNIQCNQIKIKISWSNGSRNILQMVRSHSISGGQ